MLTEYRYLFGDQIGRLHFAGTETGQRWWGNMEAALASGERAAREILAA
jgi:monoamine oxidase